MSAIDDPFLDHSGYYLRLHGESHADLRGQRFAITRAFRSAPRSCKAAAGVAQSIKTVLGPTRDPDGMSQPSGTMVR